MFSQDFKEFVQLLEKHQIEYLIVGGYAVGYYGYPRYTGDLDIWLNPTKANASKLLIAIKEFGFGSLSIKLEDFTTEGNILQLGYPPLRIDLLTSIDGVSFNECFAQRNRVEIDDLLLNFINYRDLVQNKKSTGRHKDLDDIENMHE